MKKKEKQPWKRVEFLSGTKIIKKMDIDLYFIFSRSLNLIFKDSCTEPETIDARR